MAEVHATALVHPKAHLSDGVSVGPYSIIEEDVSVGEGTCIGPHCVLRRGVRLGPRCRVYSGVILGEEPQVRGFDPDIASYTSIGAHNVIREFMTIHRSLVPGGATLVGDGNYLMALSHIAHDCKVGDQVVLCNGSLLAGHVEVGDHAFISGAVVIEQFCKIGSLAMLGGGSAVNMDVPPYMTASGYRARVRGLNLVGIRRQCIGQESVKALKEAYRILYRSGMKLSEAVARMEANLVGEEVQTLVRFLRNPSKLGISPEAGRGMEGEP